MAADPDTRAPAQVQPTAAVAWAPVLAVAGALLAVLLVVASRYGPHRDELYFVAAGRRLAWGYPDQPSLTPLVARVADLVAPGSVLALHVPAALAAAGVVVLSALTARELGGRTAAQALTAVAVATGTLTLVLGHMLSTATLDLLLWTVIVYAALVVLRRDVPRGWLVVGAVGGLTLHNKHLAGFLLAAIAVGVALTPAVRHHLRSPWAWAGAGLAVLLWLPNVLWQASHGWPQLELAADIRAEYLTAEERVNYVLLVLVMLSPVTTVLWVYGLARLWRVPALRAARPFAWAFALLVVVFFVTGGKAYYLAGLLPVLVAAGATGLEARWSTRGVGIAAGVVAAAGLVMVPAALPVLDESALAGSFYADVVEDQLEMAGWPELVSTVDAVVEDSGAALVVTGNYGEAGALEFYGSDVPVHSGHNGYGDWGPPPTADGPVVLVGMGTDPGWATGCRHAATIDTGLGNEEDGVAVLVCDGPRGSWAEVWDEVRHLSA